MEFTVEGIIFLGIQQRVSKKTQKAYKIASFLGEDGNVIQCMVDGKVAEGIEQFDRVDVHFVITGRYNNLIVKNIIRRGN